MPDPGSESADLTRGRGRRRLRLGLGGATALAVLYGGLCKALLFHNLEYVGSDLFSFLDMSWSWYYAGPLLYDNVYGNSGAIHNFYLLPAFSPLTIPLGAYGFILGLVLLNLLAALRIVFAASLDLPGRLVLLTGLLSPIAYFVFDHREWGFHPELCYAPLGLLLALELLDGRPGRAIVTGLLAVLVKEDGAVLCASVLLAYFAGRLWENRKRPREERLRMLAAGVLSLSAVTLVFAGGMAILLMPRRTLVGTQTTATPRVQESLKVLREALAGRGDPEARLRLAKGVAAYALVGALFLLPLGRRFSRGALLLLLSCGPLVIVLAVSSAGYGFRHMVWPPRLATFLGLVLACQALASSRASSCGPATLPARAAAGIGALVLLSWGLQLVLLSRRGYSPWPRLNAEALLSERGYRLATLPKEEVRLVRCVAQRLPGGLPVVPHPGSHPMFHRQSILFEWIEGSWQRARLRVVGWEEAGATPRETSCRGPEAGGLVVEAECSLLPLVAGCGRGVEAALDPMDPDRRTMREGPIFDLPLRRR